MQRLSEALRKELLRIAAGSTMPGIPHAGWLTSPASRALAKRGLIRKFPWLRPFGAKLPLEGNFAVTWYCAELTPAGRAALERRAMGDGYTCALCKGVFEKGWSDEEALEEKIYLWGHIPRADCDLVCDDCFKKMGLTDG